MGTAHVLVRNSVLKYLKRNPGDIRVLGKSYFGQHLWLALVESSQLPEGYWHARELVIWDNCGHVLPKLKIWAEL